MDWKILRYKNLLTVFKFEALCADIFSLIFVRHYFYEMPSVDMDFS